MNRRTNKHRWQSPKGANMLPCVGFTGGASMSVCGLGSLPAYSLNAIDSQTALIQGQESLDRKNLRF